MNNHVHPIFQPLLNAISAPLASPPVAKAAQSTRTPADVLLKRLTPRPSWEVWAVPHLEEPFRVEMTLTQASNETAAMEVVTEVADKFNLCVIHTAFDGIRHDVSQRFAERLAVEMSRAGFDAE